MRGHAGERNKDDHGWKFILNVLKPTGPRWALLGVLLVLGGIGGSINTVVSGYNPYPAVLQFLLGAVGIAVIASCFLDMKRKNKRK